MEASSREKIMFAPEKDRKLPTLVNKENFDTFFHYNFSERSKSTKEEVKNLDINKITELKSKIFPKELYNEYFNIDKGISVYKKVYGKVIKSEKESRSIKTIIKYVIYCKYLIYKYNVK